MGSHHQMTPVNDGIQPEASFSGAGDTKVEGRAKSQEDEREKMNIYAWSVGSPGDGGMLLQHVVGDTPIQAFDGTTRA